LYDRQGYNNVDISKYIVGTYVATNHVNSVWGLFKTLLNNFHNNTDGELATLTRTRPHCTTAALTKKQASQGD